VSSRLVPVVNDARSFAKVARDLSQSIRVIFISSQEICETAGLLKLDCCFAKSPNFPGISKYHCLEPQDDSSILCRYYSYQSSFIQMECKLESDDNLTDNVDNVQIHDDNGGSSEDESDDSDGEDGDVKLQLGLPKEFLTMLNNIFIEFAFAKHHNYLLQMILDEDIVFANGRYLLTTVDDLKAVYGNSNTAEKKWLSNFVIDAYLELIKSTAKKTNTEVENITWEEFEKVVGSNTSACNAYVAKARSSKLLQKDINLCPMQPTGTLVPSCCISNKAFNACP